MEKRFSIKTKILVGDIVLFIIFLILGITGVLKAVTSVLNITAIILLSLVITFSYKFILFNLVLFKNFSIINRNIEKASSNEGDLVERLPVKTNDEISFFSRNYNIFIAKIHNIVFKLKNIARVSYEMGQKLASSSAGISTSIEEITSTLNSMETREEVLENHVKEVKKDVSDIRESIKSIVDRINDQAASINQSSAAVEETIASIKNINFISESKKDLITSLTELAKTGEDDMSKTLESIKNISETAGMIRELIAVINNLAAQTNLLAMNAAIEAAHAGEYGSGFSVVAGEIRVLAETTALNSKDITKNLNSIILRINESTTLTEKTDQSIKMMIDGIEDVADSMNEIINGLKEMSAGTSQITTSLGSLQQITGGVQSDSNIIDDKSQKIDQSMEEVQMLSEQSNASIKEFALGVKKIKDETNFVAEAGNTNLEYIGIMEDMLGKFKIIDSSNLLSTDGHPLIRWNKKIKNIPARPENPEKYPEDNENHWYDMEYAGWGVKKVNIPESHADGAEGKHVILLLDDEHPYLTGFQRGVKTAADFFKINLEVYTAKGSAETQAEQVEMSIKKKPDMIILICVDAQKSVHLFKKLNEKSIPVIAALNSPGPEGSKYVIGQTGPDEWAQFRLLAHKFAEFMNKEGSYCILPHVPGIPAHYARKNATITELKKIAPKMIFLDSKYTDLNREKTKQQVRSWIESYGSGLKGIVSCEETGSLLGAVDAIKEAGREDIVVVSAGNPKVGMDLIKTGDVKAMTYQPSETDGALALEMAKDWFNGLDVDPIRHLPMHIITSEDVENFYPPLW